MAVIDNSQIHNYQEGFLIYDETYIFKGKFLSSQSSIISEICFNTTMTGYQETMTDPSYKSQLRVNLEGEVLYPGTYTLAGKQERLSDLIKRAGGLREQAYPQGATLHA